MTRRQRRRRASRRGAHRALIGGGMAVMATLASGDIAQADQTLTVSNTSDCSTDNCGSLRDALKQVNHDLNDTGGDKIVFAAGVTGTISLSSYLVANQPVEIVGPGAGKLTIRGPSKQRVMQVYDHYGATKLSGLTLSGGYGGQDGGGGAILMTASPSLELDNVVVSGNTTRTAGGGIEVSGGSLTLRGSTISGNTSPAGAGGILAYYSNVVVENSTISGNTGTVGAGLYSRNAGVRITDSTVAGNPGSGAGTQVYFVGNDHQLTLQDAIVSGSTALPDIGLKSASGSASFSLIRHPAAISGGTAIGTDGTDIKGKDPLLGALGPHGGPTPTMVPKAGSPVLDKGKSFGLKSDQRGLSRPFAISGLSGAPGGDRSDMGAVEVHATGQPRPPDTSIVGSTIKPSKKQASFKFKAIGAARGFQCALVKVPKPPKKPPKPLFKACTSPKTYKDLKPGNYVFRVRAFNAAGHDPTPAKRAFKI